MTDIVEKLAERRFNYERARAFGAPVLRSLHPDALLVGYSVLGDERSPRGENDRMVEANHVVRSSIDTPSPVAFTTRTWKFGVDHGRDFLFHALDHIRNGAPRSASFAKPERDELLQSLKNAARREIKVRIDGVPLEGTAFDFHGSTFVRLPAGKGAAMISIAAPPAFLTAGFSGTIPE